MGRAARRGTIPGQDLKTGRNGRSNVDLRNRESVRDHPIADMFRPRPAQRTRRIDSYEAINRRENDEKQPV